MPVRRQPFFPASARTSNFSATFFSLMRWSAVQITCHQCARMTRLNLDPQLFGHLPKFPSFNHVPSSQRCLSFLRASACPSMQQLTIFKRSEKTLCISTCSPQVAYCSLSPVQRCR